MTELTQQSPSMGEIILYQDPDGSTQVDVKFDKDTLRLNLNQITQLFGRDKSVISRHIKNIFSSEELDISVVAKNATTEILFRKYLIPLNLLQTET